MDSRLLRGLPGERGHPEPDEHVLEQLVVGLHRGEADSRLAGDARVVDHLPGLGGRELEEPGERGPVLDERLAAQLFLEVDEAVGAQQVGAPLPGRGRDAGQLAESEPLDEFHGGERPFDRPAARQRQDRGDPSDAGRFACRRPLGQDQRVEVMQEAAPGQEVRPGHAQLAGGTAAEHEAPAALVGVVEVLHRVEERRDVLRLVHHHRGRPSRSRQRPAALDQEIGVPQELRPLSGAGQVEPDRGVRKQLPEQRGLAGLSRAEQDVDVRGRRASSPSPAPPSDRTYSPLYNRPTNLKSSCTFAAFRKLLPPRARPPVRPGRERRDAASGLRLRRRRRR